MARPPLALPCLQQNVRVIDVDSAQVDQEIRQPVAVHVAGEEVPTPPWTYVRSSPAWLVKALSPMKLNASFDPPATASIPRRSILLAPRAKSVMRSV